jgi:hypothetical protein
MADRFRTIAAMGLLLASAALVAPAATPIFQITQFADPPWSLTYFDGFYGTVGATNVWPAEMGWQGSRIDIAFNLPASVPPNALQYRFQIVATNHFDQSFNVQILAGNAPNALTPVHSEYVDRAGVLSATLPLDRFTPGQTNYLRIEGTGVLVGPGQPAGIRWVRWALSRTDLNGTANAFRTDQLQRLTNYIIDAIQPSGLVRDGLPHAPGATPFHPATPDAAGFALLGLCVADEFGLIADGAPMARTARVRFSPRTRATRLA